MIAGGHADAVDEKTLGLLTGPSGGATFRVAAVGDRDLVGAAAKDITDHGRGQYVVGFIDSSKGDPSAVTIQVGNHSNFAVFRSRTAGPPASKDAAAYWGGSSAYT